MADPIPTLIQPTWDGFDVVAFKQNSANVSFKTTENSNRESLMDDPVKPVAFSPKTD